MEREKVQEVIRILLAIKFSILQEKDDAYGEARRLFLDIDNLRDGDKRLPVFESSLAMYQKRYKLLWHYEMQIRIVETFLISGEHTIVLEPLEKMLKDAVFSGLIKSKDHLSILQDFLVVLKTEYQAGYDLANA
jgi:hypothetical protein